LRGLLDRFHNTPCFQAFFACDQRFGGAFDNLFEVRDLIDEWIGRADGHGRRFDGVPPACAALMLPKPHIGNRQCAL
jgi:hypothetical protein